MFVLSKEEIHLTDRYAVDVVGMRMETLMECAGQAISSMLIERVCKDDKITILCGTGNNGGDGMVVARRLLNLGYKVKTWLISSTNSLRATSLWAYMALISNGYAIDEYRKEIFYSILDSDVIVDAMLGVGFEGEPRSPYNEIIQAVNESRAKVFSVDLPSGVTADNSDVSCAIKADETFTIQFPKISAFSQPASQNYGKLTVVDIGIPVNCVEKMIRQRNTWNQEDFKRTFPRRAVDSYKGRNGKALIIGGSANMIGAPILAARACIKSGIGLLTLAIPKALKPIAATQILEATYVECSEENGNISNVNINDDFNVVCLGMGMGQSQHTLNIVKKVIKSNIPAVIDADALCYVNELKEFLDERKSPVILTPHLGEMSVLCGKEIREIEQNRFEVSREYAMNMGVYLVLKGPNSIVTSPNGKQYIATQGNSGLAKGGSGDALSGIITGFIPNHEDIMIAIINAVHVHGRSADILLENGHSVYDITATDVIQNISAVLAAL